jgi:hypothetical protein
MRARHLLVAARCCCRARTRWLCLYNNTFFGKAHVGAPFLSRGCGCLVYSLADFNTASPEAQMVFRTVSFLVAGWIRWGRSSPDFLLKLPRYTRRFQSLQSGHWPYSVMACEVT